MPRFAPRILSLLALAFGMAACSTANDPPGLDSQPVTDDGSTSGTSSPGPSAPSDGDATSTPPELSPPEATSDQALVDKARAALPKGDFDGVTVAYVDTKTNTIKYANFGATNDTEYEIGSVSKVFTGQLLAIGIERGEVKEDDYLSNVLPISVWAPSSATTLLQLATHYGGFARWPLSVQADIQSKPEGANPIPYTYEQLVEQAAGTVALPGRGTTYAYSNIGTALLGHGLAQAAHTTFRQLLQDRLLTPMGLTKTRYLASESEVTPETTRGTFKGKTAEPCAGDGYAPAMGLRSTIVDMASFTKRIIDGTAPGMSALTPRKPTDVANLSIGYQWFTEDLTGLQGKNGQTMGFSSVLVVDRTKKTGAVVLANTSDGGDGSSKIADAIGNFAHDLVTNDGP